MMGRKRSKKRRDSTLDSPGDGKTNSEPPTELSANTPICDDDIKLLRRAVREGWVRQRWPTNLTLKEFKERTKGRSLTLVERILRHTHTKLIEGEDRLQVECMKLGLQMEAQNLREDLAQMAAKQNPEIPVAQQQTVINQSGPVVMIVPSNGRGPRPDQVVDGRVVDDWDKKEGEG